jgi:hypothetical protein
VSSKNRHRQQPKGIRERIEQMTERENPLTVRWDTEHEEADTRRLREAVGDDFAVYLDRNGWQITMKSVRAFGGEEGLRVEEEELWPMIRKTTATPLWASDRWSGGPERKIKYRPYTIFGFGYDDESDPDPVS